MLAMPMTLDVSRLSGWLNAFAPCPVTPSHVVGDMGAWGVRGPEAAVAVLAACTEELTGQSLSAARARGVRT